MVIGVDEAGRGPVLGSMFVAAVSGADEADLLDGIGDSKAIAPERREELAATLTDLDRLRIRVEEVPPDTIDEAEHDLNELTIRAAGRAIRGVATADDRCVIDACDVDVERFARRLRREAPNGIHITARHRADEDHPFVGAASIVAKHHREAHVDTLAEQYGAVGSGYAHDETTRAFLRAYLDRHGDLPACARRSWQTCADLLAAAEQGTLADFASD